MPLHDHRSATPDISALGANLAALAVALTSTAIFTGSFAFRRVARLAGGEPRRQACGCEASRIQIACDGSVVRHHYSCCCVPPCYGCGR